MKFTIEATCDIGCVRKNNEDIILIGDQLLRDDSIAYTIDSAERNFWIAVSDGMGGHQAGELASQMVLEGMRDCIKSLKADMAVHQLSNFLDTHIRSIHQKLNQIGNANSTRAGLGATFNGLLSYNQSYFIINIGDSRLYRLRGGLLTLLTNDHSLRNLLKDNSVPSNQIVNAFGGGTDKIFFDLIETNVLSGDTILLCSDGLNGELTDPEIEDTLISEKPLSIMIQNARERGGHDNISAIKIQVSV